MLRTFLFFTILIFFLQITICAQTETPCLGKVQNIQSKILNEEREILVSLPANYSASQNNYPVLFLLDGEVHFDYISGVVSFLANNNRIPQMIVVGISNTNRMRDYSPIESENYSGSGGADSFLNFLDSELFPYLEKNYRASSYRMVVGHSLCGLFSLYTLLKKPETFNSYIAISPYVVYGNNFIMDYAVDNLPTKNSLNKHIYYTVGGLEPEYLITSISSLTDIFNEFAPKDLGHKFLLMEGDDHSSSILLSVYDGLKYIFNDWRLPDTIFAAGLEPILNHYDKISQKYGYNIRVTEDVLNAAGYHFLQNLNDLDMASKIFKKNIELYPESANVYDSYGEYLEATGKKEEATIYYKKAIALAKERNHPFLTIFEAHLERVSN